MKIQGSELQRDPNKNAYAGPHTAVDWNIFFKIVGSRILESRNLPQSVGPVVVVLEVLVLVLLIKIVEPTLQCLV